MLQQAVPVTEAAIVVNGNPLDNTAGTHVTTASLDNDSVCGMSKLLTELHVQFDIVESTADLDRYRLLILPDNLTVDEATGERLNAYLQAEGAIIAGSRSLRLNGEQRLWPCSLGLTDYGTSPYTPAYLSFQSPEQGLGLFDDLPAHEYRLYDGWLHWRPSTTDIVQAWLGEPLFQRGPNSFTSHAQTPFDHLTPYAAIVRSERFAATAFPIGSSYHPHGYWIYREIFRRLVDAVLPHRLITTNAPISTEVTVTHQCVTAEHPGRWLVHLVNFSPNRRSPAHCEYLEDPIPLTDIRIALHIDATIAGGHTGRNRGTLNPRRIAQGWEVIVPQIRLGEIVVFEQ